MKATAALGVFALSLLAASSAFAQQYYGYGSTMPYQNPQLNNIVRGQVPSYRPPVQHQVAPPANDPTQSWTYKAIRPLEPAMRAAMPYTQPMIRCGLGGAGLAGAGPVGAAAGCVGGMMVQ